MAIGFLLRLCLLKLVVIDHVAREMATKHVIFGLQNWIRFGKEKGNSLQYKFIFCSMLKEG